MHCSEGENKMKQFLYLDTDIVNSIIAQSEKVLYKNNPKKMEATRKKTRILVGVWKAQGQQEVLF